MSVYGMADFDYKKHFDIRIPQGAPYDLKTSMESVIQQYASTPEGRENILAAVKRVGKIVVNYDSRRTSPMGRHIDISPEQLSGSQHITADGQIVQTSLNRAFAHEMGHLVIGDKYKGQRPSISQDELNRRAYDRFRTPDMPEAKDIPAGQIMGEVRKLWNRSIVSPDDFLSARSQINRQFNDRNPEELEVIRKFENPFMAKYYGEPPRREDVYSTGTNSRGTSGLEFYPDITHNRHLLTDPKAIKEPTLSGQDGADRKPRPQKLLEP